MQVPFLDLHVQHEPLRPGLVDAFRQVAYPELRAEQIELAVRTPKDRLCC